MSVRYHDCGGRRVPDYVRQRESIQQGRPVCQHIVGEHVDKALCANMTETSCVTAISEQGGKENQYGNDERFCSGRYRCDGSI
jgi:hypothetical protein